MTGLAPGARHPAIGYLPCHALAAPTSSAASRRVRSRPGHPGVRSLARGSRSDQGQAPPRVRAAGPWLVNVSVVHPGPAGTSTGSSRAPVTRKSAKASRTSRPTRPQAERGPCQGQPAGGGRLRAGDPGPDGGGPGIQQYASGQLRTPSCRAAPPVAAPRPACVRLGRPSRPQAKAPDEPPLTMVSPSGYFRHSQWRTEM